MFPFRRWGVFLAPVRRAENSAMSAKISKRHELKIQLVSSEDEIFSRLHLAYFRTALLQVAGKNTPPAPLQPTLAPPQRSPPHSRHHSLAICLRKDWIILKSIVHSPLKSNHLLNNTQPNSSAVIHFLQ